MSEFTKHLKRLAVHDRLHEFEEAIRERLAEAQTLLDEGKDVQLYRAQGSKKSLMQVLDMPLEISGDGKEGAKEA